MVRVKQSVVQLLGKGQVEFRTIEKKKHPFFFRQHSDVPLEGDSERHGLPPGKNLIQ